MTMSFELGRFSDFRVIANGWWSPRGGQRVTLRLTQPDELEISRDEADYGNHEVSYTWPRNKSNQEASLLAIRYFERNTKGVL